MSTSFKVATALQRFCFGLST